MRGAVMANPDLGPGMSIPSAYEKVACPVCGHDVQHHHDRYTEDAFCEGYETYACGCEHSWQALVAWYRHYNIITKGL